MLIIAPILLQIYIMIWLEVILRVISYSTQADYPQSVIITTALWYLHKQLNKQNGVKTYYSYVY